MILYLPNPADATKLQNVMMEHTHFSSNYVSTAAAVQKTLYNQYDIQNDMAAIKLFKNSLSSKLLQQVKNRLKPNMCFIQAWLVLFTMVQTDSLDKYEKLKNTLKSHTPFLYAGKNILDMAQAMCEGCDDLVVARYYDQTLTMVILESFLLTEGSQFHCQELLTLHPEVHSMIITNHYKHHDEQQDAMIAASVSFDDICHLAEDLYHTDLQKGHWHLAVHNKDSKLPPHVFANLSQTQAFALQQQCPSTKNCCQDSSCNGGNHGQNHCDSNSKPSGGHGGCGGNGHSHSRNSYSNDGPTKPSWHHLAPTDPNKTTHVVDGTTYFWWGKCNHWTTMNTTDQHVGHRSSKNPPNTDLPIQA